MSDNKREVAGAIPIYEKNKIVLVENWKGNFIFPKGGIKQGESPEEACSREAKEEGGIEGTVNSEKSITKKGILFFVMEVSKLVEDYKENTSRKRLVLDINEVKDNKKVPKYIKEILEELNLK